MTAGDLLDLLDPATAGRVETLCGQPLRHVAAAVDAGDATVQQMVVVASQVLGTPSDRVMETVPTVAALRNLVDAAVANLATRIDDDGGTSEGGGAGGE